MQNGEADAITLTQVAYVALFEQICWSKSPILPSRTSLSMYLETSLT